MEGILESVKFYYNIAFQSSLESYLETFLSNFDKFKKEGYMYFPEYGGHYMRERMILDDDINPIFATDTFDRKKYIKIWLEENNNKMIREFYSIKSSSELLYLNINILSDSFDFIFRSKLIKYLDIFHIAFFEIIEHFETLDLENKITKLYTLKSKIGDGTPPFNLKNKYSHKFFNKLYDFLLENDIINENLAEEPFVNTLLGFLKVKIIFEKDMYHIVYLFDKLKIFFDDFTTSKIEDTKIFFTSNKNSITTSNINTHKTRLKSQPTSISEEFKSSIDNFIAENLK